MEKSVLYMRILRLCALICLAAGFLFAASSPDKVFVGIAFIAVACAMLIFSLIIAAKIVKSNSCSSKHK